MYYAVDFYKTYFNETIGENLKRVLVIFETEQEAQDYYDSLIDDRETGYIKSIIKYDFVKVSNNTKD